MLRQLYQLPHYRLTTPLLFRNKLADQLQRDLDAETDVKIERRSIPSRFLAPETGSCNIILRSTTYR